MRLVTTLAQREADIAKVLGYKLVERLNLIFFGRATAYELFRLCTNLFIRSDPAALEFRIPLSHFIPTLKGGHLHLGRLWLIRLVNALFFFFVVALISFEVCVFPVIDAPLGLLVDARLKPRFRFELNLTVARDI